MAHEEQNDPVAQSPTSKSPTTSTAGLSEGDFLFYLAHYFMHYLAMDLDLDLASCLAF